MIKNLGSVNFAAAQATGAHVHMANGAFHNNAHALRVRSPPAMGAAHGMADVVAVHEAFSADLTILAHFFPLPELVATMSITSFPPLCKCFFITPQEF